MITELHSKSKLIAFPKNISLGWKLLPGQTLQLTWPHRQWHRKKSWNFPTCGLYYRRITIVIDAPSVVKVTLQIVASLTIVIDDAS